MRISRRILKPTVRVFGQWAVLLVEYLEKVGDGRASRWRYSLGRD